VGNQNGRGETDLYWRDSHVRIEGPAVADFQRLFLDMWNRQDREEVGGEAYFPPPESKGKALVRVLSGMPEEPVPDIYAAYLSGIVHARDAIHLTHAYFLPGEEMLQALSRAARRGVDVKIIVPGRSDFWMPFYAGRYYYTDLLEAGVRLFERQGTVLHSKTAVIDGVWTTVGSSNLDTRSFLHDAEVNAVILCLAFAEQMEAVFAEDLAKSDEILPEEWLDRPFTDRFLEWFAQIFQYWL
jgi:cardiolipin synthase